MTQRKSQITPRPERHAPTESVSFGQYAFTVVITPNDPEGYLVTCPALPGLVTEGDTLDEAREMAGDAIKCYVESLLQRGQPVPEDRVAMAIPVVVKVA